jgi:hypothetical protein
MKRRTRIKELETSEAALARLRAERTRLDAEIVRLEERREADVLKFVVDTAKRLNIAQLPAASILAALEQLAQRACEDRPVPDPSAISASTSDDPRQGLVVFVRLTRNTSAANREMLAREGLHWNGRSAGWSGRVTPGALDRLRDAFDDRVEGPADTENSAPLQGEANAPPVEVAADPSPVVLAEEPGQTETAAPTAQLNAPAATRLPTSPFRLPPRRPAPT